MEAAVDTLPEHPVCVLQPSRGWVALNLRDLWAYRELLYFLIWRDVKVRYKQTVLGVAWAVIQPLFTMLVFSLFFGKLAHMPSDEIPYPLFALAGLLPWTFFSNAVSSSGNSLVGSANLVTKVYFPRMIIPGAAVLAGLVDLAIAFGVLAVMMLIYGTAPGWGLCWLPLLVLVLAFLATGVGMWMSALNVKYRDIRYALPFLIQLWMFATPIIYPSSLVPEKWRWLLALNPLTGIIEGFRAALFDRPLDGTAFALSTGVTAAVFVWAAYSFRRMEARFADVI
ncbi:MAG: ABC transporter permease [Gemmataceae bacterium]|nr:ABC transporter permease [Gemmataceae bacterium]